MPTIRNDLYRGDTRDKFTTNLAPGTYYYNLTVSGEGKLGFRVRGISFRFEGNRHHTDKITIERKSKIRGGTELSGTFDVFEFSRGINISPDPMTRVEFIFTRKLGTKGVDYVLEYDVQE